MGLCPETDDELEDEYRDGVQDWMRRTKDAAPEAWEAINGLNGALDAVGGMGVNALKNVIGGGATGGAGSGGGGGGRGRGDVGEWPIDAFKSTGKAPLQTTPGTRAISGEYVNDIGQSQPWTAHYDEFGRQVGRTDYNAGNVSAGIPDTHFHTYEWPSGGRIETGQHVPGEYIP